MKSNLSSLKQEIVDIGKRLYNRGYVASNDGNLSIRLDSEKVLITPTGVSKGFMKPDDLIVVDLDGKVINGKRKHSSESNMHLQIYRDRPDVGGVCHTHAPYATSFAVAGIPLDLMILPEVIITLGTIPLVEYGATGTEDLYRSISNYVKDYDAFLLANHGVLAVGNNLLSAYHKMETVEHAAHIQFLASQLGKIKTLNKKQVAQLLSMREKFGIRQDIGISKTKTKGRK